MTFKIKTLHGENAQHCICLNMKELDMLCKYLGQYVQQLYLTSYFIVQLDSETTQILKGLLAYLSYNTKLITFKQSIVYTHRHILRNSLICKLLEIIFLLLYIKLLKCRLPCPQFKESHCTCHEQYTWHVIFIRSPSLYTVLLLYP